MLPCLGTRAIPLLVALGILSVTRPSAASEGKTFALSWVRMPGAESCIGAVELARAIDARLGRRVIVPPADADVSVEGRVEPIAGDRFRAVVVLSQPDGAVIGAREVVSTTANCRELDPKLVLVIALTVDPNAIATPPEAGHASPTDQKPERVPPKVVVRRQLVYVRQPERKQPAKPWVAEIRIAGAALVGLLPDITPGLLAAVSIEPPHFWPVELWGSGWLEREAGDDRSGARLSLLLFGLRTCPSVPFGAGLHGVACAGFGSGALWARGFGFDHAADESKLLFLATAGIGIRSDLTSKSFAVLGLSLDAALLRPRFFYRDSTGEEHEVYRVPAVGAHAELGFGLRF